MFISKDLLLSGAAEYGVSLSDEAVERFDIYARLLVERNKVMNLTAITESDEIVKKHFVDSLSLISVVDIPENAKVIDVGTGAGFPGIPLMIARPDLRMTLLDSTRKRLGFIEEVSRETSLEPELLHSRAEDAGKNENYRERYDLATARAVSNLRDLSEYCLPFVKKGGVFAPMKSAKADEEITQAKKAIHVLGGRIEKKVSFDIGDVGARTVIIIKKISQTPTKYPRPSAKMAKFPIE